MPNIFSLFCFGNDGSGGETRIFGWRRWWLKCAFSFRELSANTIQSFSICSCIAIIISNEPSVHAVCGEITKSHSAKKRTTNENVTTLKLDLLRHCKDDDKEKKSTSQMLCMLCDVNLCMKSEKFCVISKSWINRLVAEKCLLIVISVCFSLPKFRLLYNL